MADNTPTEIIDDDPSVHLLEQEKDKDKDTDYGTSGRTEVPYQDDTTAAKLSGTQSGTGEEHAVKNKPSKSEKEDDHHITSTSDEMESETIAAQPCTQSDDNEETVVTIKPGNKVVPDETCTANTDKPSGNTLGKRKPALAIETHKPKMEVKTPLNKCSEYTLNFIYIVLSVSLMLSLSRWGCLTTLTITYINATLTPGNNALLDSQLLAIGNLIAQTCRMLQFAMLIYGVSKFRKVLSYQSSLNILSEACKNFCACKNSPCTVHSLILLIFILLYCAITWPPPALLTTWFPEFVQWHDNDNQQHASIGYSVLAWFHHISDLIIRLLMGIVTRLIMVAWFNGQKVLNAMTEPSTSIEEAESQETTCSKFSKMVKNYKETGKVVAALQDIFQEWFVMSWVVYFIGVTGNTTLVLKALFKGFFWTATHRSWFYFAHLVNDFAAFIIPYICGGLMNYYHEMYRETLEQVQEDLLSDSETLSECVQQRANLIPVNPNCKFVPALCCINIPLESAGYSFTLILTSFAFVLSFITAFTNI